MAASTIPYNELHTREITGMENLADFKCSKPAFAEYLRVTSVYDQDAHMGRTYVFVYKGRNVGYVVLAMAHLSKSEQKNLGIDTYGDVPALLISHLATHKEYERRGIGRNMVVWTIRYAKIISKQIGCRVVLVKSDPDVVRFYERLKFVHATLETDDQSTMYFDIKERGTF